jgi:hypothetical protein
MISQPNSGVISANQTICYGGIPTDIVLSGYIGTIQWQVSTDNINFSDISGATGAVLATGQMSPLFSTNGYYRAKVSVGSCFLYSDNLIVTVYPAILPGTVTSDQNICLGGTVYDLGVTGNTGSSIQWQISSDNNTFINITGANSAILPSSVIGSNCYFKQHKSNN